jgi:hypothetical protein
MKPEKNHSQTSVGASIYITPIDHITGDVAGLLANFLDALLVRFYPRRICQKVNVVVSELVTNVIQHGSERDSEVRLDLNIDPERLLIKVSNRVTPEEYQAVKAVFDEIFAAEDPRELFARTVRARRNDNRRGGLGLIRLTAENKFHLSTQYDEGVLVVQASFP